VKQAAAPALQTPVKRAELHALGQSNLLGESSVRASLVIAVAAALAGLGFFAPPQSCERRAVALRRAASACLSLLVGYSSSCGINGLAQDTNCFCWKNVITTDAAVALDGLVETKGERMPASGTQVRLTNARMRKPVDTRWAQPSLHVSILVSEQGRAHNPIFSSLAEGPRLQQGVGPTLVKLTGACLRALLV
jgi:hypothetical protein